MFEFEQSMEMQILEHLHLQQYDSSCALDNYSGFPDWNSFYIVVDNFFLIVNRKWVLTTILGTIKFQYPMHIISKLSSVLKRVIDSDDLLLEMLLHLKTRKSRMKHYGWQIDANFKMLNVWLPQDFQYWVIESMIS